MYVCDKGVIVNFKDSMLFLNELLQMVEDEALTYLNLNKQMYYWWISDLLIILRIYLRFLERQVNFYFSAKFQSKVDYFLLKVSLAIWHLIP